MKHAFIFIFVFFLLLPLCAARAETGAPSYVDLADAPTIAVDWSKGDTQTVTLHGDHAFVFFNGRMGGKYLLIVKQDMTGSRTVTWPVTAHWPGGGAVTLTTTANKTDYITFFYNGVSYDAIGFAQNF